MQKGDRLMLSIAEQLGEAWSTCTRRQIGCLIYDKEGTMIATGVNRTASGHEECKEKGCIRDQRGIPSGTQLGVCRAVHAEINALLKAGPQAEGGVLYVSTSPCPICARAIASAGIRKVFYLSEYSNTEGINILEHYGVRTENIK